MSKKVKVKYIYCFNTTIIEIYMKKQNLTKEEFAKKYYFNLADLEKILKNDRHIPLYQIVKLSRIMSVAYEDLFVKVIEQL